MALREQEVEHENVEREQPTKRTRITFDVSPELRRRIKVAATKEDISIGEYLGHILEQMVPEEAGTSSKHRQPITYKTLERVLQVHERIKEHTEGYLFEDSTELIHQMREERARELEQV